jgi:hypothetical protein
VTLDVTPGAADVFQAYPDLLDEAGAALDRASELFEGSTPPLVVNDGSST